MKSDLYIKWDIYARQDDIVFRRYCRGHIGYGVEVFLETVILLRKNEGNAMSKTDIIECVQETTLIDNNKITDCIESMVNNGLLKIDEEGNLYSERVKRDIDEARELSEKKRQGIKKRWEEKTSDSGVIDNNKTSNTTNTNTNTNTNTKTNISIAPADATDVCVKKPVKKFTPPTLEEVQAYCSERGKGVDAQRFIDYYSTGNWHDSHGDPIKNWKQKMIANWEGKTWWQKAPTLSTGITLGQSGHYKPEDYEGLQEKLDNGEDIF